MINHNSRVGLSRPYIAPKANMLVGPGTKAPGVERKINHEKINAARQRKLNADEYARVLTGVRLGDFGAPYNLTRADKMKWRELRGLPPIAFT